MKNIKRWIASCSLLVLWLVLTPGPAAANGAPFKIFLNYLPQFSNYGPTAATGVANVSIGEAWVELSADGLPRLSGEIYEAWIINAETEKMVSLGKFNADSGGHVEYSAELDDLPIADYRYFVITVEPIPDTDAEADARWTIAGIFPDARIQILIGTPTPTPLPGVTPVPGAPVTLPVTGVDYSGVWLLAGVVLSTCLVSAIFRFKDVALRPGKQNKGWKER